MFARVKRNSSLDGRDAEIARSQRWGLEAAATTAVLLLVAIGSLTPFAIDQNAGGFSWPGWPGSDVADVATNLMVYIPVGAALAVLLRRFRRETTAAILAVLIATMMSLSLETAQSVIRSRYASWYDVFVNSAGAACGVVLVLAMSARVERWARGFRVTLRRRPAETLARVTAFALVTYAVAPFDFVSTAEALSSRLRSARLPLLATVQAGRLIPDGPTLIEASRGAITQHDVFLASGFLIFGCLTSLARRRQMLFPGRLSRVSLSSSPPDSAFFVLRSSPAPASLRSRLGKRQRHITRFAGKARTFLETAVAGSLVGAGAGWLLAVVIETLQLFCAQHAFDVADLLLNGVGATVGAIAAAIVSRPGCSVGSGLERSTDTAKGKRAFSPLPMAAIVLFWMVQVVVAASMVMWEGLWSPLHGLAEATQRLPFAGYFKQPFAIAIGEMLEPMAIAAAISVTTLALILRLTRNRRCNMAVQCCLALATLTIGSGAVLSAGGSRAGSDLILFLVTAVVVGLACRRLVDARSTNGA